MSPPHTKETIKGLPAIKRAVHTEELKRVLALRAYWCLLVGCPPQNASDAACT